MNLARSLSRHISPLMGRLTAPPPVLIGRRSFGNLNRTNVTSVLPLLIVLLLNVGLAAQDAVAQPIQVTKTDFKAGYFGNVVANQGLNLGVEYLLKEKVKTRQRRKGLKVRKYQLILNGSLGYSTNFSTSTHNGVYAYSGVIFKRVNTKSYELFVELNPLGLYRSVLPETYEVDNGTVSEVSFPGRSYYAPSVALGLGRFRKVAKRTGWYLNLQYTFLTNYNAGELPVFSIHYGRKFNFSKR